MSLNFNRAYQNALSLYHTANPTVTPVDSARNMIQYIVEAILIEMRDHWAIPVGSSITYQSGTTGGGAPIYTTIVTTAAIPMSQIS